MTADINTVPLKYGLSAVYITRAELAAEQPQQLELDDTHNHHQDAAE
jgi:hypothetical protein